MPRFFYKNFILIFIFDIIFVAFSWYFANLLRYNFYLSQETLSTLQRILPLIVIVKILCLYLFDLYQGMWRYTSLTDLFSILKATTLASLVIIMLTLFVHRFGGFSRSVYIIDWGLTLFLIAGSRLAIRLYFWLGVGDQSAGLLRGSFPSSFLSNHKGKRLLIIGAGDCGEKISREIHDNPSLGYSVMGFIDDDSVKTGRRIHGIPILGDRNQIRTFSEQLDIKELLIAMPSVSSKDMREIVSLCGESGIPFKTVPGMGEIIDGRVSVKAIRDVSYRDLLGREPVILDETRIAGYLKGKRILITGAGGSIGSELCRQVCRFSPETVILYERAESPLYDIELELKDGFPHIKIAQKLADILDPVQLEKAFEEESPQVVFHAAAYKHVPMLEMNPWEAISNNVIGTRNVIDISRKFNIDRFVLVSTDKAVRPANVMGASKRLAELLVQAQNGCGISKTRFMTVRFGNVVGSVGSVVPLFKKQIEKGGPVTVTHPEITRYFMTIPEACQLILQAGSMGEGGEIFILDMGIPIKIADMAEDLIRLSGFEPYEDIEIKYIGLRPGEKLYEELITEGEGIVETSHKKIMVLRGAACEPDILNRTLDNMMKYVSNQDGEGIRGVLKDMLPEYNPQANVMT
ncbi:MAG: polysaccharide biosynthesis protein [Deltaproteobacteria bacterium]|nr:polysaccharide biosynthesis protein [Deltaproteobacteria bacterium]